MDLTLFKSYAIPIILSIFMIFIDNSAPEETEPEETGVIPAGCKVILSGFTTIILPKGYKINIPDKHKDKISNESIFENESTGSLIYLPKDWIVTFTAGFKLVPAGGSTETVQSVLSNIIDNDSKECKINLPQKWMVMPTKKIHDGVPEASEKIIIYGDLKNEA